MRLGGLTLEVFSVTESNRLVTENKFYCVAPEV